MASTNERIRNEKRLQLVNMYLCDSKTSCHLVSRVYRQYVMVGASLFPTGLVISLPCGLHLWSLLQTTSKPVSVLPACLSNAVCSNSSSY